MTRSEHRTSRWRIAVASWLIVAGCSGSDADGDGADRVLARAGKAVVRLGELSGSSPPATAADRRKRLEARLLRRRVVEEARRRGLHELPESQRSLEAIERASNEQTEAVLRDALFAALRSEVVLEEAELRQHYETTRGRYLTRQVELRRLGVASREEAERALTVTDLASMGTPERIGPAPLELLGDQVLPEAARLERPGARVLVEGTGRWSVLELVELRRDVALPFEAARDRVADSLRLLRAQEALRELLAELSRRYPSEFDEAALHDEALWKGVSGDL